MTAPWVQLGDGTAVDLLNPRIEPAQVPTLLRALCRINRFNGHTLGARGYTVGQHSLLVADLLTSWGAPPAIVRKGLLHDLPEAIYGDMVAPLFAALEALGGGEAWRKLRASVDAAVFAAVGVHVELHPLVKRADLVALAIERRDLMAPCATDWELPEYAPTTWPKIEPERDVFALQKRLADRLAELDRATGIADARDEGVEQGRLEVSGG